jgi:hypothetical protein
MVLGVMLLVPASAVAAFDDEVDLCVTVEYDTAKTSGAALKDQGALRKALKKGWARVSDPETCIRPAPNAPEGAITRDDFGDDWPFTFDYGTPVCDVIDGFPAARIVGSNGVEYALNGVAISRGFVELDADSEVWLENIFGNKVSIGSITPLALALCE